MSNKFQILLPLLAALVLSVQAQDVISTTTVQPANMPQLCNVSTSMSFDPQKLAGTWWEVARNPAPAALLCVEILISPMPNNIINIDTTYSNTPTYPWVNQTMTTSINYNSSATYPDGFNISYVNGLTNTSYTVFKLLDTDYSNYALICGYTNATDNSTTFGLVLTRQRVPTTNLLNSYEAMGSEKYKIFLNGSMYAITQDSTCNSADRLIGFSVIYAALAQFLIYLRHF